MKESHFIAETLRLNERYLTEVVERFKLCPWALQTRRDDRLAREVLLQHAPDVEPAAKLIAEWSENPAIDVGLVIFPQLNTDRQDFERFANQVGRHYAERSPLASPQMALAAFHPNTEPDFSTPERLIPYVRCTPDPTIQVVRIAALEAVRADEVAGTQYVDITSFSFDLESIKQLSQPGPSLRKRISQANHDTLSEHVEQLQRIHTEIQRDRQQLHQRYKKERLA